MTFTPKKGDEWEFKLPNKPRRKKQVGKVRRMWVDKHDEHGNWVGQKRIMYVEWYRLPKGRYSGIRVRTLLKYGKRISTKADRDAAVDRRWEEMKLRRPPKPRSGS